MKAIVYTEYGPPEVLQLKEVAKPLPKVDEVLIRIHATAVNSGDCRLRKPDPFVVRLFWGLFKPKTTILGVVFAGKIENIGQNVTQFKIGDDVFGMTGMGMGAYAEYKCLPEKGCIAVTQNLHNLEHFKPAICFLLHGVFRNESLNDLDTPQALRPCNSRTGFSYLFGF